MTEIDFYSGGDRLHTACRLVSKAVRKVLRVMVYTPDISTIKEFDSLLWTFSPTDFIPHCHADDRLSDGTPVILSHKEVAKTQHDEVLLNLDAGNPSFFSRFCRLIEVAGTTPEEMQAARKRYRFYQDRGYEIRHHRLEFA